MIAGGTGITGQMGPPGPSTLTQSGSHNCLFRISSLIE